MKRLLTLFGRGGALLLAALLSSCVLASCSQQGNGGEESTSGTAQPGETTGPVEKMDFADMDLSPYVSLGQYKNIEVSVPEMDYLVSLREVLLKDGAYFEKEKEGEIFVKEGDIINVDYTGYLNGVAFEGGKASNQDITVYDGKGYIDGFATGFIGAKVGEKSEFNVTFPEDYGEETLAGKEVTFEFELNHIYIFDELTDEMATDLSKGAYPTAEEYEAYQRSLLVQAAVWPIIVENATVKTYPEQQLQYYYRQNRNYYEYYAALYDMSYTEFLAAMGLSDAKLYESAKLYVEEDLVYYAIRNIENIVLTEEEYNARIDSYTDRYKDEFGYTDSEIRENLAAIEDNMLYDKVQETIVGWAVVTWTGAENTDGGAETPAETTPESTAETAE